MNQTNRFINYFELERFEPPPALCLHPKPTSGRDDDINKLQKILDDVLLKSGIQTPAQVERHSRILFAPDNKIGKNLIA